MLRSCVPAIAALLMGALIGPAGAEIDLEKGARAYYFCYNCHSLEPGVHLTGPSLANVWGRRAGAAEGFTRYSEALRAADFVWTETTLDAWFEDPQALVPGNTMIMPAMKHAGVRANLIAFLKLAGGPNGALEVVARGLLPAAYVSGRVPKVLAGSPPDQQVTEIRHCEDAYVVTTADGDTKVFWERNLHFKTDTSARGPQSDRPVLIEIGSVGDRASIVFASPAELAAALAGEC